MNWFDRHLNLTFVLAWLLSAALIVWGYSTSPADELWDMENWGLLDLLAIIIFLVTEVWYLLSKKRSLLFLFLNLLSWIGVIILLSLNNKAKPKIPWHEKVK